MFKYVHRSVKHALGWQTRVYSRLDGRARGLHDEAGCLKGIVGHSTVEGDLEHTNLCAQVLILLHYVCHLVSMVREFSNSCFLQVYAGIGREFEVLGRDRARFSLPACAPSLCAGNASIGLVLGVFIRFLHPVWASYASGSST